MPTPEFLHQFAKSGQQHTHKDAGACVIYTRVSTKEQADNNLSLETQKKACVAFAQTQGLEILAQFGGTYESAKSDERKEFQKMLAFVKRSRTKISTIVVYSVDRFSRSGPNAIYIADQLRQQGIVIQSVTQPTDTSTPVGAMQQYMQFIFSEYDNQLRRQKCMAGVREKLLRGEWVTKAPMGYDQMRVNGQQVIQINKKGKLLRKAFYWKAEQGLSNVEIVKKLRAQGMKMY